MFDDRRYTALPIIVGVFRFVGGLVLVALIISLTRYWRTDLPPLYDIGVAFGGAVALMAALVFVGLAELLQVLMDIEENTRKAADDRVLESAQRRRRDAETAEPLRSF